MLMKTSRLIGQAFVAWGMVCCAFLAGCSTDSYESGDGKYSYLRADFVELHTAAPGEGDYALTDEGDSVRLSPTAKATWATTQDSLYRALLYYNKVEESATPVSVSRVPVLHISATERPDTLQRDPLSVESSWVSANGRYLNLALILKTGQPDESDAKQSVGLALDTSATGGGTLRLLLTHGQNGVPQYYSAKVYVSLPLREVPKHARIELTVQTYSGPKVIVHSLP